MRVLHINTHDVTGGAGRAAYRLHRGLRQADVDSRMLVVHKHGDDDTIETPRLSRRVDRRLRRRFRHEMIVSEERRIARSRLPGSEFFSTARSVYREVWPEAIHDVDVVNLHWVAGFLDYASFFSAMPPRAPLVWTLHDIAPFTGGCHYAGPCDRFTGRCGACPQLGSTLESDISRRIFDIKDRAYAHLDSTSTAIAAPSTWVAAEARRSALMGRFRVEHIPYGLDLDMFRPRRSAREAFGIQDRDRVLLFVSESLHNRRKGLDLLHAAVESMERRDDIVLVSVGDGATSGIGGVRQLHLGRIESDELLSVIYSVADVFIIPSREDNLPQTAVEANACGCPVAGFSIGGIPDIVEQGKTGYLARPFNIRELRQGIETAIARRSELSPAARSRAERLFSLDTQARAYEGLYEELIQIPAPKYATTASASNLAAVTAPLSQSQSN